jgi:hypothetical protein
MSVHGFIYLPYYLFFFGNKRALYFSVIVSWYHYVNRFLIYGFNFMILSYIHLDDAPTTVLVVACGSDDGFGCGDF